MTDWIPQPFLSDPYMVASVIATAWQWPGDELPPGLSSTSLRYAFSVLASVSDELPYYTLNVTPYRYCGACRCMVRRACACGGCGNPSCSDCMCARCGLCQTRRPQRTGCVSCGGCSHCCRCVVCECCFTRRQRSAICVDCVRCVQRCNCIGLRSRKGGGAWPDRGKRLCGVEWEINDARPRDARAVLEWAHSWRGGIHTDGSCGWECVTPPIAGRYVGECISALGAALAKAGATADKDCGLHVHVDARDLAWVDIFRLIRVFAHIEPLLFALCGQDRAANRYCRPSGADFRRALESPDPKGGILRFAVDDEDDGFHVVHGRVVRRYGIHKKSSGRYRSLNLVPWLARGGHKRAADSTVEFRMHRNTLDPGRALGWTRLCVAIVDWIATHNDREAESLLEKSALSALVEIAPASRPWILARLTEWRAATAKKTGIRRVIRYEPGKGWECAV